MPRKYHGHLGAAERFVATRAERKHEEYLEYQARYYQRRRAEEAAERAKNSQPPTGARPMKTLAVLNVHDVRRELNCRLYERCLEYVAKKGWSGFHCEACPMSTGEK